MKTYLVLLGVILSTQAVQAADSSLFPVQAEGVAWPTVSWPEADGSESYSRPAIEAYIRTVFADDVEEFFRGARGVVVIHRGKLVAEAYREDDGYGPTSRFISWSQAKSITQALVGIAVRKGLLDVHDPVGFPIWQDDKRGRITLDNLLRMSSGLEFEEGAGGLDDNSVMMFGEGHKDMAGYAASLPLLHDPGTHWAYNTGTTMMVSRVVRDVVGGTADDYYDFIHEELLDPLGMKSGVPEFDQTGTFLGGAFFYATTRDYARFGLLYLRDGIWDGKRILPDGWVNYSRSITEGSNGEYGVHFWLGPLGDKTHLDKASLVLPDDMFQARGMGGQFIAIFPSRDVVIAYNGYSQARDYAPIDEFFARILLLLEE